MTQTDVDIQTLVKKAVSKDLLDKYKSALDSGQLQSIMRDYHKSQVEKGSLEIVEGLADSGKFTASEILLATVQVWLMTLSELHDAFDSSFVKIWEKMPDMLCRILIGQATQALQAQLNALNFNVTPEMEADSARLMKLLRGANRKKEARQEHVDAALISFSEYQSELKATEGLALLPADYLEVWTRLLFQVYIFSYLSDADVYHALASNWEIFMDHFPDVLEMMVVLRGYEELMLPENAGRLQELIQNTPELKEL